jgi:hypothetical protein
MIHTDSELHRLANLQNPIAQDMNAVADVRANVEHAARTQVLKNAYSQREPPTERGVRRSLSRGSSAGTFTDTCNSLHYAAMFAYQ